MLEMRCLQQSYKNGDPAPLARDIIYNVHCCGQPAGLSNWYFTWRFDLLNETLIFDPVALANA